MVEDRRHDPRTDRVSKSAPVERVNKFICCEKKFSHPEFIAHITTEHGFVKGMQCRRSLVTALDGSSFYWNTYEWEIPCPNKTLKVTQHSSGPRDKGDLLAMWGEDE